MSDIAYLFPMALNQLQIWQRTGVHSLSGVAGVWARLDDRGLPVISADNRRILAEAIPVFEDDFEVVIGMAADPELVDRLTSGRKLGDQWVPLSSLKAVFPISDRGEQLLNGKVSASTPLRSPLEIQEIQEREMEL